MRGHLLRRHLHHILNMSGPEELNEEEQLLEFFDEVCMCVCMRVNIVVDILG